MSMLHAQKIEMSLNALSHMIEKTFHVNDALHLRSSEDCQYLFYLHVCISLVPRTAHTLQ